jgi:hypothetical protein
LHTQLIQNNQNIKLYLTGVSTWQAPNFINIKKFTTKTQKANLLRGLNCKPFDLPKSVIGNNIIVSMTLNLRITSDNLLGIDLNIA